MGVFGALAKKLKERAGRGEDVACELKSKHGCISGKPGLTFDLSTSPPSSSVGAEPLGRTCRMFALVGAEPGDASEVCQTFRK